MHTNTLDHYLDNAIHNVSVSEWFVKVPPHSPLLTITTLFQCTLNPPLSGRPRYRHVPLSGSMNADLYIKQLYSRECSELRAVSSPKVHG